MDTLRTPSWRKRQVDAVDPAEQPGSQPAPQPGGQPPEQPVVQPPARGLAAPAGVPTPSAGPQPGNVVSGTGIPLAEAAAMDGVPSVQALRKRIKKGTLRSVRVLHRDAIVVGVELEELARHYDVPVQGGTVPGGTASSPSSDEKTGTEPPVPADVSAPTEARAGEGSTGTAAIEGGEAGPADEQPRSEQPPTLPEEPEQPVAGSSEATPTPVTGASGEQPDPKQPLDEQPLRDQPGTRAEQPGAAPEQPRATSGPADNPPPGPPEADPAPGVAHGVGRGEQPAPAPEPAEEAARAQALETVDMAVQGWREAREALDVARREHREEITRTIAAYENQLQLRDQDLARTVALADAREVRAVRWGRVAALGLVVALAAGVKLTGDAGERLATERVRAGILSEEKGALEADLARRGEDLSRASAALEEEQGRSRTLDERLGGLEAELDLLQQEREQARAAARAALRAMSGR